MIRAPVIAVVVVTLAAGCLGGATQRGAPPVDGAAADESVQIGERPDPTFGNVTTGPVASPDAEATLDAPPRLVAGEWWRIRFESPFTGETVEFVRVVAAVDGESYVVGMPHEGWYKEAVVYHAPGFGDVNADLSYLTHNVLFTPLQFPLTADATWTTQFSGGPEMTARVTTDPVAKTATVTFTSSGGGGFFGLPVGGNGGGDQTVLELVYDATIHEVREFRHQTLVYEVIEHGYGFEGWITIPRGEDMAFFHGRIGPALDLDGNPAPPTDAVELSGGFNRVTFIHVLGGVTPAPGAYREVAKAPDGTEYVTEAVPGGPVQLAFHEATNPDGAWELTHVVGGAGIGFMEGIAYHQYDVRLPDGAKRSDHSHAVIR